MLFDSITSFASVIANFSGSRHSLSRALTTSGPFVQLPTLRFTCFACVITDWPALEVVAIFLSSWIARPLELFFEFLSFWNWDCSGHLDFLLLTLAKVDVVVKYNWCLLLDPKHYVCDIFQRMTCDQVEFSERLAYLWHYWTRLVSLFTNAHGIVHMNTRLARFVGQCVVGLSKFVLWPVSYLRIIYTDLLAWSAHFVADRWTGMWVGMLGSKLPHVAYSADMCCSRRQAPCSLCRKCVPYTSSPKSGGTCLKLQLYK